MEEHYRKLESMYLNANVNTQIFDTTTCNIEKEKAIISLEVDSKYFHALGAIHGSVYFKLLDDAAFFAVSSVITDVFALTTNFNTNITRPVSSGKITSIGKLKFQSKNLFIAESSILDQKGREIAFGTGHFAKSRIALSEEIGYRIK